MDAGLGDAGPVTDGKFEDGGEEREVGEGVVDAVDGTDEKGGWGGRRGLGLVELCEDRDWRSRA